VLDPAKEALPQIRKWLIVHYFSCIHMFFLYLGEPLALIKNLTREWLLCFVCCAPFLDCRGKKN
ncbi:hypothetical protein HAX54_033858, partial [Datura stramonium]|nr:hypothetical protein [Datura stramonium]